MTIYRNFETAHNAIAMRFKHSARKIHTKRWQGEDVSLRPDMVSWELLNEHFTIGLAGVEDYGVWANDIMPNLPWADDHFEERVSGAPLNPGVEWANWPWASSADKHRTEGEMFNHTYAERLWPRHAGMIRKDGSEVPIVTPDDYHNILHQVELGTHQGIRGEYGDLGTLVEMLAWEPDTRQAYIPLYFPEDTGLDGRKPCTLGYQFIMRDNRLSIFYPLRSCDFVRHWRDDCYLAVRLLLWVLDECRKRNPADWNGVRPGDYVMHMTSLHVFANDAIKMGLR